MRGNAEQRLNSTGRRRRRQQHGDEEDEEDEKFEISLLGSLLGLTYSDGGGGGGRLFFISAVPSRVVNVSCSSGRRLAAVVADVLAAAA